MVRIIILLILLAHTTKITAQETAPYHISKKKDLPIFLIGTSGLVLASVLNSSVSPLTQEQIAQLSSDQVNAFDRPAISKFNAREENISDILLGVSIMTPISLFAEKRIQQDFMPITVMLSEVAMINIGVTSSFKGGFKRIRPYVYNPDVPITSKTDKKARHAYFSGHVSNSAALSFFTASVVSKYSKNQTVKKLVWTGAILLPATMGYLRYSSGKHFPTDVITGYLVGASIGYLIPKLHENKPEKNKKSELSYTISPGYFSIAYQF